MTFSIEYVSTHGELSDPANAASPIAQWADIKISIPKDFDFSRDGKKLLAKIEDAANLIGRGE